MGPVGVESYVGPPAVSRSRGVFLTEWDASIAAETPSGTIQLPLIPTGIYDFTVHWGDGTSDHITSYDDLAKTHTYQQPGSYTVAIQGLIRGWAFSNSPDAVKITRVIRWGCLELAGPGLYFYGCSNLQVTAKDAPDLRHTNTLAHAFRGCTALRRGIAHWDVSHIQSFLSTFEGCSVYDEDLAPQPTRCVRLSNGIEVGLGPDIGNGEAVTIGLRFRRTADLAERRYLIHKSFIGSGTAYQWMVRVNSTGQIQVLQLTSGGGAFRVLTVNGLDLEEWTDLVTVLTPQSIRARINGVDYETAAAGTGTWSTSGGELRVGLLSGGDAFNGKIRDVVIAEQDLWDQRETLLEDPSGALAHYAFEEGAGTRAYNRLGTANHMLWVNANTATLHATDNDLEASWANGDGFTKGMRLAWSAAPHTYSEETAWIAGVPLEGNFRISFQCANLSSRVAFGLTADTSPDLSGHNYTAYTVGLRYFNASQIEVYEEGVGSTLAESFTANDILTIQRQGGVLSLLKNGTEIYTYATETTAPLYGAACADTPTSTTLEVLEYAQLPLTNGYVGSNVTASSLFIPRVQGGATDVAGHIPTYRSGAETPRFNPEGANLLVTTFYRCSAFNGDVSTWDTSGVTHMGHLFRDCARFNQDISRWDTSAVVDMSNMFRGAAVFNQPIGIWDVASVASFVGMFYGAAKFNQSLSDWNTGSATNMQAMFQNAAAFAQPVHTWNFSNVTDLTNFQLGTAFTLGVLNTSNYDNLLEALAMHPSLQHGVTLGMGSHKYNGAWATFRSALINDYGWTILDGGAV